MNHGVQAVGVGLVGEGLHVLEIREAKSSNLPQILEVAYNAEPQVEQKCFNIDKNYINKGIF